MRINDYRISEDLKLVREMLGLSQQALGRQLGVTDISINRWENEKTSVSAENCERFYSYAYDSGIFLNRIKEQFYREEVGSDNILLFHGAKASIDGPIRVDVSRFNNDFGKGFYTGESLRQAGLFVSNFSNSCIYILSFDATGLAAAEYCVDREWLLTIAAFRGRLQDQTSESVLGRIKQKALDADYIVAPIADNRMYQIIDSFIDGEITDRQCIHSLAATDLGMQYVIRSDNAASHVKVLERCYLCANEKSALVTDRSASLKVSENKVRAARIKYRGKGKYIDELL